MLTSYTFINKTKRGKMMKFNHRVKFNGILYEVGQNVPIEDKRTENKANTEQKTVAEKEVEYTKTDINRMSTADLKKLAKSEKIENAEDMNGAELKKALIDKFDL